MIEGSRSDNGNRSRVTDVQSFGVQATKIGSWSDESYIAFPIEAGRLQPTHKPANFGRADMFHGDSYPRQRMNYGNPYSSGNQCPIDPHKWKENGFIWNKKGWFRKAKHPDSVLPRNWHPSPESSIPGATIERGNPHSKPNLVPLNSHGNFHMRNGRFR